MELPIKTITMMILVILVLIIIGYFLLSQASSQQEQADVGRVFSTLCEQYKIGGCSWSLTKEGDFADFLNACRSIYGSQSEAYSCLYVRCPACRTGVDSTNLAGGLKCASTCEQCRANGEIGVKSACCQQFKSQCSSSGVSCADTCP